MTKSRAPGIGETVRTVYQEGNLIGSVINTDSQDSPGLSARYRERGVGVRPAWFNAPKTFPSSGSEAVPTATLPTGNPSFPGVSIEAGERI